MLDIKGMNLKGTVEQTHQKCEIHEMQVVTWWTKLAIRETHKGIYKGWKQNLYRCCIFGEGASIFAFTFQVLSFLCPHPHLDNSFSKLSYLRSSPVNFLAA